MYKNYYTATLLILIIHTVIQISHSYQLIAYQFYKKNKEIKHPFN